MIIYPLLLSDFASIKKYPIFILFLILVSCSNEESGKIQNKLDKLKYRRDSLVNSIGIEIYRKYDKIICIDSISNRTTTADMKMHVMDSSIMYAKNFTLVDISNEEDSLSIFKFKSNHGMLSMILYLKSDKKNYEKYMKHFDEDLGDDLITDISSILPKLDTILSILRESYEATRPFVVLRIDSLHESGFYNNSKSRFFVLSGDIIEVIDVRSMVDSKLAIEDL